MKVDYSKPIRLKDDDREVKVAAVTNDGFAIVTSEEFHTNWVMFTPDGEFHSSSNGQGTALKVENVPEEKKLYLRLSRFTGDIQTSVDNKPMGGTAVACIELTLNDGIVTGAELYRANEQPITHFTPIHTNERKEI